MWLAMTLSDKLEAFEASAVEAARLMKALANERRLLILCQLADGEQSVGSLRVGLSQSALSQHLALLRQEGIVKTRREAQTILYSIADPAVHRVIRTLAELYGPQPAGRAA